MTWKDILDILIIAYLVYRLLLMLRGTRAIPMGMGLFILLFMYFLGRSLNLQTVYWLMSHMFSYLVLVIVVLFQHEIRRFLTSLLQLPLHRQRGKDVPHDIEEIVLATVTLSSQKTGSLIVIERQVGLESYIDTGIRLDARLSYDLLTTIFYPGSPLHDGAAILRGHTIVAASCFLPLTSNPYLARTFGARHRAAIGLTEESDALVLIVSEESGKISLAEHGRLRTGLTATQLRNMLLEKTYQQKLQARRLETPKGELKTSATSHPRESG